ncbi:MAG: DUF3306 domain-containing protein [Alphaproteobacteria bacterium]|nr:DUF3306 domain-containing protein [Alphaproteobacteria bacterium]
MNAPPDFWSRRRAAVAEEERAHEEAELESRVAEERAALAARTDEDVLAALELPDPDSMKQGDDFSAFMAEAVPERLRRRALRRLWRSNPVLANLDNLVDYGEDYTDAALVMENLQTAYRVGKGMLKHLEAMAEAAERAEKPEAGIVENEDDAVETEADTVEEPAMEAEAVVLPTRLETPVMEEAPIARAKPRMRFAFVDAETGQAA